MIRVKIKRKEVLQEALTLETMGLPKILITLIKQDLARREDQVRLALMLKKEPFKADTSFLLKKKLMFNNENFIFKSITKMPRPDPLGRAAIKYAEPHFVTAYSGQFYNTSKLQDPQLPSPYWKGKGVDIDRPLTIVDVKGMRKTFKKFVRKVVEKENEGIAGELNKTIDDSMDEVVMHFYNSMVAQNMGGATLIAFLLEHPTNEKAIEGMDITEAIKFAWDYQNEKEDEDNVVITYDKGLFWYNIGESNCSIEADRMGHCGDDMRGNLYSLRSKRKNQKISDSHVTISYNEFESTVYQIKGKGNCTPDSKYGPYIVDFLKKMEVSSVQEEGEHSSCDFTEFIKYLEQKYPEAEYGSQAQKVEEAVNAINNGNYNTEYIEFSADDISWDIEGYGLRIDAYVRFEVPLPFLNDYEDLDFIEELFEDDHEAIKEKMIDECAFEDYDTYSDTLEVTLRLGIDKPDEEPHLIVGMQLSPYNNDIAQDTDTAEENINNIKYGYTGDDIAQHEETIQKIVYKQFEDVLNPDGRELYQDIINNIEKLRDSYRYFNVEGDEDSIEFSATIPLPIEVKGIPNGAKYSSMPYNKALNKYAKTITGVINLERYTEKIDDLLDIEYEKIMKAIKRQTKIPFPDFEHQEEKDYSQKPFSFNSDMVFPRGILIRKGETQAIKMKMNLEVHNLDNKATILYVMKYVKFLEENMDKIVNKLNFSHGQAVINQAYKRAIIELHSVSSSLEENKKRKINVKIRR